MTEQEKEQEKIQHPTLRVSPEQHQALKVRAALQTMDLQDVTKEAFEWYLGISQELRARLLDAAEETDKTAGKALAEAVEYHLGL